MHQLHLGTVAHVTADPFQDESALEIIASGGLVVAQGKIVAIGDGQTLKEQYPEAQRHDHGKAWLIPGMIDGHIHYPQFYATAAYGEELLDWLNRSIFPRESKLRDAVLAKEQALAFCQHLLANGTTTALVFGSQYLEANLALFDAAIETGLRVIGGMTMMDRHAPEDILVPVAQACDQVTQLIEKTQTHDRLAYAVTPRFAITCSDEMMKACHQIMEKHPEVYFQTHINESREEIQTVAEMYPNSPHYTGVYDQFGLLGKRSVLAHNIHANDAEMNIIKESGTAICHCPASNGYLGSGLFPLKRHLEYQIPVMMGTDIGAGTNFSLIPELAEAYKVQQLQRFQLNPAQLLYLGTLAGAKALSIEDRAGNFQEGKDADFFVLDPGREPYLARRLEEAPSHVDQLFVLLNLANQHHISATWTAGKEAAKPS